MSWYKVGLMRFLLALSLKSFTIVSAQDPVANLPQGRIVGIKVFVKNSLAPIEIYYGVPYAIPPTGRYRFSAPERHPGWKRTLFAHRSPPTCPEANDGENKFSSEDCLFLNIWSPRNGDGSIYPVIVILYSETRLRGGVPLPCQELAAEGVIVVTVSYRHHLLAYFTLRTIAARGNLALLDQYLALIWVRENIAAFGGDPTAITLLGHSAGADSVLYHMASKRTIGLYHRVIIISPRDFWNVFTEMRNLDGADTERASREIAQTLGCTNDLDVEILNCMRSRPFTEITSLYSNSNWSHYMRPIPDFFLPDADQYLPLSLSKALSERSVINIDLLLGTVDLESVNYNERSYEDLLKLGEPFINNFTIHEVIPNILRLLSFEKTVSLPLIIQAIRWEFYKDRKAAENDIFSSVESLARIESSGKWGAGVGLLAARLARRVSRLYVFRYSQPGINLNGQALNFTGGRALCSARLGRQHPFIYFRREGAVAFQFDSEFTGIKDITSNILEKAAGGAVVKRAVHGVDLVSLLGDAMMLQVSRRPATLEERTMTTIYRKHIIQFVKTGSVQAWKTYKTSHAKVYDIYDSNCHEPNRAYSKELAFWLQYLPGLVNLNLCEHTEKLTYEKGENRVLGGVFAFSGITAVLVILLAVCAFLLRRQHAKRNYLNEH